MFYDNFDRLCTSIGTSPTAFTRDVLGLSTSKVTAWKNGSIPKYEILQQIADVFNVSVGELFDGENEKNAPTEVGESELFNYLKQTYSTDELKELASLSRDKAVEIVEQAKKLHLE